MCLYCHCCCSCCRFLLYHHRHCLYCVILFVYIISSISDGISILFIERVCIIVSMLPIDKELCCTKLLSRTMSLCHVCKAIIYGCNRLHRIHRKNTCHVVNPGPIGYDYYIHVFRVLFLCVPLNYFSNHYFYLLSLCSHCNPLL